ncbi:UNVERIFIED_CONTAM: hypothetical protein Sradi_7147700 [Sesamum radiatum]|uniref:Uncharacterized protein n=1 Tax=Sesamum radiatum TaxID=300843 RepID=A0AAW2IWB3_SESRA
MRGEGSERGTCRGLQALADQVRKEFPDTEEAKTSWRPVGLAARPSIKKSEAYQKEVALVAGPFLFTFEACRK